MPPLEQRLALAEQTMRALGHGAELPPKMGVHPRQAGSIAQAMPALLRGEAEDGSTDLIGVKWITGFPVNPTIGLPTYHALVVLNDPVTGQPLAIMDAAAITAQRTAAISGTAIRYFLPAGAERGQRSTNVAILGAGVQARSHIPVVGYLLPGARVRLVDVDRARANSLVQESSKVDGIGFVEAVDTVREAVETADVVISVVSFGPDRQALDPNWLGPRTLFIAVDHDMQASAALAREAVFVVDDRDQFVAMRTGPEFAGYPDPDVALGELFRGEEPAQRNGGRDGPASRILVAHLGVGLADVVFAAAILNLAADQGLGRVLPR
jgi:alanine dehydrogenase